MPGENTVTTMDALFHEVWLDGESNIINLVPEVAKLQKMIGFDDELEPGDVFKQMIETHMEQGLTHAGPTEDVVTLNAAEAPTPLEARVQPCQLYLRSQLGYNALIKAEKGGKKAFRAATEHVVTNMTRSLRKVAEFYALYGQRAAATVGSLAGQVISILSTDGSSTWSEFWRGSKNMFIDVYQSDGTTLRQAGLKITSVSLSGKSLTVSGTVTGIAANDLIYLRGANASGTLKAPVGVDRIATATTTLYNIDPTANPEWAGQSYAVGGNLSMLKILEMADRASLAGAEGDMVCLIPTKAFSKLNSDQSTLRRYDTSFKKDEALNGVKSLRFVGPSGDVAVVPHPFVKESEAHLFVPGEFKRVGREISFNRPGPGGKAGDGKIFLELSGSTGFELRALTFQTTYTPRPSWIVKGTGITYA